MFNIPDGSRLVQRINQYQRSRICDPKTTSFISGLLMTLSAFNGMLHISSYSSSLKKRILTSLIISFVIAYSFTFTSGIERIFIEIRPISKAVVLSSCLTSKFTSQPSAQRIFSGIRQGLKHNLAQVLVSLTYSNGIAPLRAMERTCTVIARSYRVFLLHDTNATKFFHST